MGGSLHGPPRWREGVASASTEGQGAGAARRQGVPRCMETCVHTHAYTRLHTLERKRGRTEGSEKQPVMEFFRLETQSPAWARFPQATSQGGESGLRSVLHWTL